MKKRITFAAMAVAAAVVITPAGAQDLQSTLESLSQAIASLNNRVAILEQAEDSDTLGDLACTTDQIAKFDTDLNSWVCAQDETGGSGANAIEFIGFATTNTFQGDAGLDTLYSECRSHFNRDDARMCFTNEYLSSPNLFGPQIGSGAWILPNVVAQTTDFSGLFVNSSSDTNCRSWSSSSSTDKGFIVTPRGAIDGQAGCNSFRHVACCALNPQ